MSGRTRNVFTGGPVTAASALTRSRPRPAVGQSGASAGLSSPKLLQGGAGGFHNAAVERGNGGKATANPPGAIQGTWWNGKPRLTTSDNGGARRNPNVRCGVSWEAL